MTETTEDDVLLRDWAAQDPTLPCPGFYDTHPAAWHRHHTHQKQLAAAQKDTARIVFLGDSITQGWDTRLWYERIAPLGAINLGIGGDRTSQILWRLDNGLLDGLQPKLVVLAIGVNHLWHGKHPPERIAAGIEAVANALGARLSKSRLLLVGILPCMAAPDHPYRRALVATNALTARLADGDHVRYSDPGPALLEPDGTLCTEIAPDGVHLSLAGYERLARQLLPAIHEAAA